MVTGAGDGIGAAVARRFAAEGAKVLVAEVNEETGRAVADAIGGRFLRTDVGDKAQVLAMVDTAVRVRVRRASLAALYSRVPMWAFTPLRLHMLTTRPQPRSRMCGNAARIARNGP